MVRPDEVFVQYNQGAGRRSAPAPEPASPVKPASLPPATIQTAAAPEALHAPRR